MPLNWSLFTPSVERSGERTSQLAASVYAGTGSAITIARSDHLHDDRYDTSAEVDAKAAAAIATPKARR